MDVTRTFYQLAYRIGFHPWEDLAGHPPFADTLVGLIAQDEAGREPPYGPALDLGCGSGVWGVRLAQRGWQVTGIDMVATAVRRARGRAKAAGVDARFVQGDVTTMRAGGIEPGYRLILDTGTFHGLTDAQRSAMAGEVDAVAAEDATVLLDCFGPRRRGPLPRGATRSEVEAAFGGWKVTDSVVADTEPDPLAVRLNFDERFYRLRRE